MKQLSLYQQQIAALKREREKIDLDFAQLLAEGLNDGHSIVELIDEPGANPNQQVFDL